MIRTLIVDDEQPARERLYLLLRPFKNIEIIGEAENGEQALEKIKELAPDLVFLDIQMPICTGLEVAAALPSPRPAIVFCTAYDQFAVDAFELAATDYLLKPVSRSRLAAAIQKIERQTAAEREDNLTRAEVAMRGKPTRFLARKGPRYAVIHEKEVCCFVSEEGLTRLYTQEHNYWIDPTLNDLELRLDATVFKRISRAAIIRLDAALEVIPMMGGAAEVRLRNGMKLEVSRRRYRDLLDGLRG